MMLHPGQMCPAFAGTAFRGGAFEEVVSDQFAGRWFVLFFYPADFTFVCPTELEDLAEQQEAFDRLGVSLLTVSTDTHFAHKVWHETSAAVGRADYLMLGDPTHALSRAVGALDETTGLARRLTVLVDPDGVVQYVEATSEGVGRSAAELLRKIEAAQFVRAHPGQVCPAKWTHGAAVLTPGPELVGAI